MPGLQVKETGIQEDGVEARVQGPGSRKSETPDPPFSPETQRRQPRLESEKARVDYLGICHLSFGTPAPGPGTLHFTVIP